MHTRPEVAAGQLWSLLAVAGGLERDKEEG